MILLSSLKQWKEKYKLGISGLSYRDCEFILGESKMASQNLTHSRH